MSTFRGLNTPIKMVSRVTFCAKVVHLSLSVHSAQSVHKLLHFVSEHSSTISELNRRKSICYGI